MNTTRIALKQLEAQSRDYARIERAIRFVEANRHRQPELAEIAASVHLSTYHFQRLFQRWAGISPKRFLQFLTKEEAKRRLRDAESTLDAAYGAGLSGTGRLHDLLVECEAVTPGEVRRAGEGLEIRYGVHPSPYGPCLIAATARGICALRFIQAEGKSGLSAELAALRSEWPKASWLEDGARTQALARDAFADTPARERLRLHLRGTNFQLQVWEALIRLPAGAVTSYAALAREIGQPRAVRAVGSAVGRNPIALLIPCHRVLRSAGDVSGYRWGPVRKQAMLAREAGLSDRGGRCEPA